MADMEPAPTPTPEAPVPKMRVRVKKEKKEPKAEPDPTPQQRLEDKDEQLLCMIEKRKKANVYRVDTKDDLYGSYKPDKTVKPVIEANSVRGPHRRQMIEGKTIPVNMPKGKKRTFGSAIQPEEDAHAQSQAGPDVWVHKDLIIGGLCVTAGLYLMYKGSSWSAAKVPKIISEVASEGSSIE